MRYRLLISNESASLKLQIPPTSHYRQNLRSAIYQHNLRLDPVGLKTAPAGQARHSAYTIRIMEIILTIARIRGGQGDIVQKLPKIMLFQLKTPCVANTCLK
jgi:hypothetical protein